MAPLSTLLFLPDSLETSMSPPSCCIPPHPSPTHTHTQPPGPRSSPAQSPFDSPVSPPSFHTLPHPTHTHTAHMCVRAHTHSILPSLPSSCTSPHRHTHTHIPLTPVQSSTKSFRFFRVIMTQIHPPLSTATASVWMTPQPPSYMLVQHLHSCLSLTCRLFHMGVCIISKCKPDHSTHTHNLLTWETDALMWQQTAKIKSHQCHSPPKALHRHIPKAGPCSSFCRLNSMQNS